MMGENHSAIGRMVDICIDFRHGQSLAALMANG